MLASLIVYEGYCYSLCHCNRIGPQLLQTNQVLKRKIEHLRYYVHAFLHAGPGLCYKDVKT